jgi:hypothetical protein
MVSKKKRARKTDVASQIQVEVSVNEEKKVFLEPAPEGFPLELFPHLADFWKRGYNSYLAGRQTAEVGDDAEVVNLSDVAAPLSGRPVDYAVQERARKATALRRQGLSYGKIALQLCPERVDRHHRCVKNCADRIRQAVKAYKIREDLERLSRGE